MCAITLGDKKFQQSNKIVSHRLLERKLGNKWIIQDDYLFFGFTYASDDRHIGKSSINLKDKFPIGQHDL